MFILCVAQKIFCGHYLSCLDYHRKHIMSSIRCSLHIVLIKEGRHMDLNRSERFVQLCNCKSAVNEMHFILECPILYDLKKDFQTNVFLTTCTLQNKEAYIGYCIQRWFNCNDVGTLKKTGNKNKNVVNTRTILTLYIVEYISSQCICWNIYMYIYMFTSLFVYTLMFYVPLKCPFVQYAMTIYV